MTVNESGKQKLESRNWKASLPVSRFEFLLSDFQFLLSVCCLLVHAAREALAARFEWKPLTNTLEISSRWIWFVPS
jgi:hypothetical protein